jgi:catechol 2,3-dioxygenase
MAAPLDPRAHIGQVALMVSDLGRSVAYYTERIGLDPLTRTAGEASLGSGERALLRLVEDPAARPSRGTTGLYHFALLQPTRAALAASLRRIAETRTPITGASDHGVSEALYLDDPDGIGIEIYRDRPREEWPRQGGQLAMITERLDLDALLDDFDPAAPAGGTTMGHVHLHVAHLDAAQRFYVDLLGFEITQAYGSQALFVSAGGYHHHIGLNTWQGVGAPPPPPHTTGLRHFEIVVPDAEQRADLHARLEAAGVPRRADEDGVTIYEDPSGNGLALVA